MSGARVVNRARLFIPAEVRTTVGVSIAVCGSAVVIMGFRRSNRPAIQTYLHAPVGGMTQTFLGLFLIRKILDVPRGGVEQHGLGIACGFLRCGIHDLLGWCGSRSGTCDIRYVCGPGCVTLWVQGYISLFLEVPWSLRFPWSTNRETLGDWFE